MPTKPAIVVIHGGCHVPDSYNDLKVALEAAGYDVYVPRLPSINGSRPPDADLSDDTKLVRSLVKGLLDEGRDVVALMHSYGGQVGSNALYGLGLESRSAQGLEGGVSHLIYMTAHALPEGLAMIDKVREFGDLHLMSMAFDFAEDGSCLGRDMAKLVVGPGRTEAETEAYVRFLSRWNGRCMYQPIEHAAWREIPVSYIHTTSDMAVPLRYQRHYVQNMEKEGREVQTFELATGHCPNFTATQELANIVEKIASKERNPLVAS
jgi:pimeloyl-ACP methyl ester carboxylesterase